MLINEITYVASGNAALIDDIVTLHISLIKGGNRVGSVMISGHSQALNGKTYRFTPVEADSMTIRATDLDFEGHAVEVAGYVHEIPRTGSVTRSFEVVSMAAPEMVPMAVMAVEAPKAGLAEMPGISGAMLGITAIVMLSLVLIAGRRK